MVVIFMFRQKDKWLMFQMLCALVNERGNMLDLTSMNGCFRVKT